jgi:glycosyltransferase involved in cell wall biosynthesis
MKLGFAYDNAYPWFSGGVEKRRFLIMRELARAGHEVHFFTMYRKSMPGADFSDSGIQYHCAGKAVPESAMYVSGRRNIFWTVKYSFLVFFRMFRYKFDFVEADAFPFLHLLPIWLYSRLRGARMAVAWHEVWTREYWKSYLGRFKGDVGYAVEAISARLGDVDIANSLATARMLKSEFGVRKVITLPAAVSSAEIRAAGRKKAYVHRKYFLVIGRLVPEKRVTIAICGVSGAGAGARLVVIGRGPEAGRLRAVSKNARMGGRVRFIKSVNSSSALYSFMRNSLALLLMSEREGLSIVTVEALSLGVPVVVLDTTMLPDELKGMCIRTTESGLGMLLRNVSKNNGAFRVVAKKASKKILASFSTDAVLPAYRKIIRV